jgi:hypothetical protein
MYWYAEEGVWGRGQELPPKAEHLDLDGFKDLSALAGVRGLRELVIDRTPAEQLARLSALAPRLESLVVLRPARTKDLRYLHGVGTPSTVVLQDHTSVERLDGIEALQSATTLTLDNFPRVRDLGSLAALTNLRRLSMRVLTSRAANGQLQQVDSFKPLGSLQSLEQLDCYSVVARDRDLSPLYALPRLADVEIPFVYGIEQLARLAGALGYDAERWPPTLSSPGGCRPRPCGHGDDEILVGARRNMWVCRICDANRVERHVAAFEAWRAQGAAGG